MAETWGSEQRRHVKRLGSYRTIKKGRRGEGRRREGRGGEKRKSILYQNILWHITIYKIQETVSAESFHL